MMCALAFSTIALGRMTDRHGIVPPLIISAVALGLGFVVAGYAPNLAVFTGAHALIGVGAGTGFGPMMADISHWFVKRRGLAVVVVASGNYFAGTIWPFLMSLTMPLIGWRANLRRHRRHRRRRRAAARSPDAPQALRRRVRSKRRRRPRPRAPMSAFLRGSCWSSWFSPASPAASRCRCRRSISSPIAAISVMASRGALRCCR